MKRQDLLALSDEDLSLLSNKGTVKRARREVEEKTIDAVISESEDGTVRIDWSEGVTCTFLPNVRLSERLCNCAATEICRHIVRAIIFYQQQSKDRPASDEAGKKEASEFIEGNKGSENQDANLKPSNSKNSDSENSGEAVVVELDETRISSINLKADSPLAKTNKDGESKQTENWDPGTITDASIENLFKPAVLKRAQTLLSQGQLVQLVKAKKPLATFLSLGISIRFLVPNDIRYTVCNCKEEQPCVHSALAVWSFRKLQSDTGIIFTGSKSEQFETQLINVVESEIMSLVELGFSGISAMGMNNFKDAMNKCQKAKLYSSAEIIEQIVEDWQKYKEVDAQFSEELLLESIAELIARHDFLTSGSAALPFLMVKGLSAERSTLLASTRLIGLGCGINQKKKHTIISAYLQDEATGSLCAVVQRNAQKETSEQDASYHALGSRMQYKSQSISDIGRSAILAKAVKLTTRREVSFGRNPFLSAVQNFDWSQLKAPVLAESFSELRQLAATAAPPYLGLRVIGSGIHAIAIDRVESACFSILDQTVTAQLVDHSGQIATLSHPYMSRGASGVEHTLKELLRQDQRCVYVSGEVISRARGLLMRPIGLVFEDNDGKRHLCQPWTDKDETTQVVSAADSQTLNERHSELARLVQQLGDFLSAILLWGLNNTNNDSVKRLDALQIQASRLGSQLILHHLKILQAEMERKLHDPQWNAKVAAKQFLKLCVVWRIAQDELPRLN